MRKLLLLSNSTLHGSGFLEYAREYIQEFFNKWVKVCVKKIENYDQLFRISCRNGVKQVLFVPYADTTSEANYTTKVRNELSKWGKY